LRKLIHVPIVHGPEDLGTQLEAVRKAYVSRLGVGAWRQHLMRIEQFWNEVRQRLRPLRAQAQKLRIYQDGLPVCGQETELARQLAAQGSRNHQLLVELVEAGAVLVGTEDPDLLRQEHARAGRAEGVAEAASAARYDDLMEARDRYVARRIDVTLTEPELGLLFMGALHRVVEKLPSDIQVMRLGSKTSY
jgi:hypothetical protein